MAAIFRQNGLAVETAESGAEALQVAAMTPPDVLVTDLTAPEMNAVDLAFELRRIVPECRVVLSIGPAHRPDGAFEARIAGQGFAVLAKPVHPAELLACIYDQLKIKRANGTEAPKDANRN